MDPNGHILLWNMMNQWIPVATHPTSSHPKDLLGQPPLGVSMLLALALEDFKASEAAAQKHLAQLLSQLPVVPVEGEDVCEDLLEKGDH